MKIRLISFYGDKSPGHVIETDDDEGLRLIDVRGGVAYAPTDEEKAADEAAVFAAAAKKNSR